jgi:hypothetical protein
MRFMILVKTNKDSEAGVMPPARMQPKQGSSLPREGGFDPTPANRCSRH